MSRYDEFVSGKHVVEMGGVKNELWADPEDYAEFIKEISDMRRKEELDFEWLVNFTAKLIKKGTPKEEVNEPKFDEGLENYLWRHVKELPNELMVAFRMATRDELEKLEEQAIGQINKKKD